ncbi:hypothetical protein HK104_010604 [Borealophlyctis nickersoniae]|nr:hypothetical protein HK104_010604 [Borealophlyctis nickersoniae]
MAVATIEDLLRQADPVVFLWSIPRQKDIQAVHWTDSAWFGAFGRQWRLSCSQYPESNVTDIGLFLIPITAADTEIRFDIFIRNEPLSGDLVRVSDRQTVLCGKGKGKLFPKDVVQRTNVNKSLVVGVAIYAKGLPYSEMLLVPPQTATSSFLYQSEGSASPCLFTHQIPVLDYGIFPHLSGNAKLADVTFFVEDQEIPAHASILQSERGGRTLLVFSHTLSKKVATARIFKALLEYIYTGKAEVSGTDELAALYCAADRFQVTTLLPYIKAELLLSLKSHLPNPDKLLRLIQQLKSFPDLSQAVRICVKGVLAKWADAKASESWCTMVGGPEAREVFELFMEEAAELQKRSKG